MMSFIVFEPHLLELVGEAESRSHAFINRNFGKVTRGVPVTIRVSRVATPAQALLVEVLAELLVRMEPLVSTVSVIGDQELLGSLVATISARFPVRMLQERPVAEIEIGVGDGARPFVDAMGWSFGRDIALPESVERVPVGAFLGALEAAKYVFARAVEIACEHSIFDVPWKEGIFDAWTWQLTTLPRSEGPLKLPSLDAAVAGCGGVAAGYLWFVSKLDTPGTLALIDHDEITTHNLNRLFFATIADALARRFKVEVAADFMTTFGWRIDPLVQLTESSDGLRLLGRKAAEGAVLISAVGEPMSRRALQRRGFAHLIDAATNTDGSIQVIGTRKTSACLDCYLSPAAPVQPTDGAACGEINTREFSGVVSHLSAGAGILTAIEHLKAALGVSLGGVSIQPISRPLSVEARESVTRCARCPYGR